MAPPLVILGTWGLGDNIYQRPFIRALAKRHDLYLDTPYPELYEDLPIKFVRRDRNLYTQMRNVRRQNSSRWTDAPRGRAWPEKTICYGQEIGSSSIIRSLECKLPLGDDTFVMDLPRLPACSLKYDKPIAFFRPVTIRYEWANKARNPKPEYLAALADRLRSTHTIVSVASVDPNFEVFVGEPPKADVIFHKGELAVLDMLALFASADIAVGGVGWIVPAGLALMQKTFVVLGGNGAHNAPDIITDSRLDLSRIGFSTPDRFCRCSSMQHDCNKTTSNLIQQFDAYWQKVKPCSMA